MAKLLTDAGIKGMKAAPGERIEHADAVVMGLRLRVMATGKTWVLRKRIGAKSHNITIGPFGDGKGQFTLGAARSKALALKDEIASGVVPKPNSARPTKASNRVADLFDLFMVRHAEPKVKRPEAYRWMADKYILPQFGDWDIAAIRRRDLADYLDGIADKHGMTTARRVGGLVKRLFKFAVSRDVLESDPAAALELPGAEIQRERTLSDAEIKAVWLATDTATRTDERNRAGRSSLTRHSSRGALTFGCCC